MTNNFGLPRPKILQYTTRHTTNKYLTVNFEEVKIMFYCKLKHFVYLMFEPSMDIYFEEQFQLFLIFGIVKN